MEGLAEEVSGTVSLVQRDAVFLTALIAVALVGVAIYTLPISEGRPVKVDTDGCGAPSSQLSGSPAQLTS
jgi:hypothetical protein